MPMYELVLWFQGNEDIRVTDQRVSIGETLVIDNRRWLVEAQDLPRDPSATARFICSRRAAGSSGTAPRPVRATRTT
jgi:hypothetical protein